MSDKELEYQKKICPICKNKDNCQKDCIYVHTIMDKTVIRCPKYDYINNT